jgi:hypothetical protein
MTIELDLHEYSVLIEAAWGAGTGLRMEIMRKAIDEWYSLVHVKDRAHLHRFFSEKMKLSGEGEVRRLQELFLARYRPGNSYVVSKDGKEYECFRYGTRYWVSTSSYFNASELAEGMLVEENR